MFHQRHLVGTKLLQIIGLCVLSVLMLGLLIGDTTVAMAADDESAAQTPLCRFGVNDTSTISGITVEDLDLAPLRIGWYLDYRTTASPAQPNGAEYAQVIRLTQKVGGGYSYSPSQSQIEIAIDLNLGATWFIGNEPDRRQFQDDIEPAVYAEAYHELYHLIKGRDSTAQIFPGSIVQATAVRLQYLDMILSSYREKYGVPLPADGWSIHGFILNEVAGDWGADIPPGIDAQRGLVLGTVAPDGTITYDVQLTTDLDLFKSHVVNFRSWMKRHGYRDLPLYMSEYGVLMPKGRFTPDFDEGRVNAFMDATFDYLTTATDPDSGYPADGNRLVQRLSWFSTTEQALHNGFLFDENNGFQPTLMGQNYAKYASGVAATLDLFPISVFVLPSGPLVQDGPADLTIHAQIANSGNELQATNAVVRVYDGDPNSGGIQVGAPQSISLGGCGSVMTAQITVPAVAPGVYQYFVQVEAVDGTDIQPNNNSASTQFFFATERLFSPLIIKY